MTDCIKLGSWAVLDLFPGPGCWLYETARAEICCRLCSCAAFSEACCSKEAGRICLDAGLVLLELILGGIIHGSCKWLRRGLTPSGANIFGKGFFGGA